MKKAIFIADAHLKSPEEKSYKDMVNFLDLLRNDKELDAVFVLGDLFDFFVGFPKIVFYEHLDVLQRLKSLAEGGVSVFYFEGNHDFFLKKLNSLSFPVEIIENSMDLYLNGKRLLLSHGDRIDKTDYAHRLMSFLVKNAVTNGFSYILPPHLVYDFAHVFSRFSREKISSKRVFKTSLFCEFAKYYAKNGYNAAILGHFHKSMIVEPEETNSMPVYLVGSWQEDREYLLWENGCFQFKKFSQ